MTQIWIAMCVYLLIAYFKFLNGVKRSPMEILRILSLNWFEKRFLIELFDPPDKNPESYEARQGSLL